MKQATYFEDLQKTLFIIKVIDGDEMYLEKREWYTNDYEYAPADAFEMFCKTGDYDGVTKYKWIAERSSLVAVSPDAPKWTDREWTKMNGF